MEFDCVVVGSGAAALTAALVAAQGGHSVLVVEKSSRFGGTSARSGGIAWLPGNPHFPAGAESDSKEKTLAYVQGVVGPQRMRSSEMSAFYDNARRVVDYLETHTDVRFAQTGYPDFRPQLPGALPVGRSIGAVSYDGHRLGAWIDRIEPPLKDMTLLGGMMVDGMDVYHLMNATKSFKSLRRASWRAANYFWDLCRYKRGMRLTFGNALIGGLVKACVDAGVTLWHSAAAKRLITDDSAAVRGVVVHMEQREVSVFARYGVVLASGGFAQNKEMAQALLPSNVANESRCVTGATGDGIRMALEVGAQLGGDTWQKFLGNQVYKRFDEWGRVVEQTVHTRRDRNKPGFILVNGDGRRYANEASSYHDLSKVMCNADSTVPSYIICDHKRLRQYGLGLVRPGPAWLRPIGKYITSGHLVRANSIAELAVRLDMSPDVLLETVSLNNEYARTGKDLDFGKGDSLFDRWQGDPAVTPNPNLGPLKEGPFYAVRIWPTNLGTFLGILTDEKARVLAKDHQPIKGLYACGCDMHHVLAGAYAGGGSVLGPGMTFGFIAANHMLAAGSGSTPL